MFKETNPRLADKPVSHRQNFQARAESDGQARTSVSLRAMTEKNMMRSCRAFGVALCLVVLNGCGARVVPAESTAASLEVIRGDIKVDEQPVRDRMRVALGETVHVGADSLARLVLDNGAELLLDRNTDVQLEDESDTVRITQGRVFADARRATSVHLISPDGSWLVRDASLSAQVASGTASAAYVINGEVAWTGRQNAHGTARAGEEIRTASASTSPATLWSDWTGGLARSGPTLNASAAGIGQLEARLPDAVGQARWPLAMRRLQVRVKIEGDLATTDVEQEFFNPASEVVEGLYRVSIPEGALLQRFAVDRNGALVDGYIRERERARADYQAQVYRGSVDDPALLEWDADGIYHARLYPIPAGATRRIVVRYTEWLSRASDASTRLYRFRMAPGHGGESQSIQEFSLEADFSEAGENVHVRAGMNATLEAQKVVLRASDFKPEADFWIELHDEAQTHPLSAYRARYQPPSTAPHTTATRAGSDERDYVFVPLTLPESVFNQQADVGQDWVVVADVSAGTDASHMELGRRVVEALLRHIGPRDRVAVVTSDLALRPVGSEARVALGPVTTERVNSLLDQLARVPAGGATDLGAAISEAAAMLDRTRPSAIVYVGDGAPTVGEMRADALLARMSHLADPVRLYAVGVGADANLSLLDALTRQSGLAIRVQETTQAADAALRLLAHASRPYAAHVSVDLGSGVRDVFPRDAISIARGDTLALVGRVSGELPSTVRVRGTIRGVAFNQTIPLTNVRLDDGTDLRLRWARERLRQLLLEGAGRESIVDLGVRYGVITPFTSFYVPSAREVSNGATARLHRTHDTAQLAINLLATPFMLMGCNDSEDKVGSYPTQANQEATTAEAPPQNADNVPNQPAFWAPPAPPTTASPSTPAPTEQAPGREELGGAAADSADYEREGSPRARAMDDAPNAAFGLEAPPAADRLVAGLPQAGPSELSRPQSAAVGGLQQRAAGESGVLGALRGTGRGGGGTGYGTIGLHGDSDATGATARASAQSTTPVTAADARIATGLFYRTTVSTTTTTYLGGLPTYHVVTRCSPAARLPQSDRVSLWTERMARNSGVSGALSVYAAAVRDCEVNSSSDRRALLEVVLDRLGAVAALTQFYQSLDDGSARGYLRAAILRRVRTPSDLSIVRTAFGVNQEVDWTLIEQMLAHAASPAARIRMLRTLRAGKTDNFELALRLLGELEGAHLAADAVRLAMELRVDPAADAGVRTAIGEMFVRFNRIDDARRTFSEIVEFAPDDELARRRLGDLYRAHGWFEDAYRQYQTLAEMRPDDSSVKLLLAEAAAGAGRIDEALRLEQGLSETATAGTDEGLARTATLWTSVRLAKLREAARAEHDAVKLRALLTRTRQSAAGRAAGALRVSLVWSHPDAALSLWTSYPNQPGLVRPTDTAPEYGIEALDVREGEVGSYRFEVRRGGRDTRTRIDAEIVFVTNEGRDDESVRVVPISFAADRRAWAWTFDGTTLRDAVATAIPGEDAQ